jgi:hypothetical protein
MDIGRQSCPLGLDAALKTVGMMQFVIYRRSMFLSQDSKMKPQSGAR